MFVMIFDRQRHLLAVYDEQQFLHQIGLLNKQEYDEWQITTKAEAIWCSDKGTMNAIKHAFNLHNKITPLKDIIKYL